MVSGRPRGGLSGNAGLSRAFAAGSALAFGTIAVTGIFVAKIPDSVLSRASAHPRKPLAVPRELADQAVS